MQSHVNSDFYIQNISDGEIPLQVAANSHIINHFARFFINRTSFVEIGAGLGMLTRAASPTFDKCYGLDLEVQSAVHLGQIPDNVKFVQHDRFLSLSAVAISIDALAAWHVIEHLSNPHEVLPPLLGRISPGGVFFGQVPLLTKEYAIPSHHIFYRVETLITLLSPYMMELVYAEQDEERSFLSFCFRKY